MNKKELIARVQRYMGPGATRSTATAAVEAVLAAIQNATTTDTRLHITRMGTFSRKSTGQLSFHAAKSFLSELHTSNHRTFTP